MAPPGAAIAASIPARAVGVRGRLAAACPWVLRPGGLLVLRRLSIGLLAREDGRPPGRWPTYAAPRPAHPAIGFPGRLGATCWSGFLIPPLVPAPARAFNTARHPQTPSFPWVTRPACGGPGRLGRGRVIVGSRPASTASAPRPGSARSLGLCFEIGGVPGPSPCSSWSTAGQQQTTLSVFTTKYTPAPGFPGHRRGDRRLGGNTILGPFRAGFEGAAPLGRGGQENPRADRSRRAVLLATLLIGALLRVHHVTRWDVGVRTVENSSTSPTGNRGRVPGRAWPGSLVRAVFLVLRLPRDRELHDRQPANAGGETSSSRTAYAMGPDRRVSRAFLAQVHPKSTHSPALAILTGFVITVRRR